MRDRLRFPLSADQLELLFSFEESVGLNQLADHMAKDPSVISRRLQQMAEAYPVIQKSNGRWEITSLGKDINLMTKDYVSKLNQVLDQAHSLKGNGFLFSNHPALLVINAQCGLLDATEAGRNFLKAEQNILNLLKHWRHQRWPVIHVKHISDLPQSPFYIQSPGCDFLPEFVPAHDEVVVEKKYSSAFQNTDLEKLLKEKNIDSVVLSGFTTNDCIDATAKGAAGISLVTTVVSDGTAMFDMRNLKGKLVLAERIHQMTLANLNEFYAKVLTTEELINSFSRIQQFRE